VKTNAARILDSLGISYELREYDAGDEHLAAAEVARRVGLPPEQVWKTLVVRGDRNGVCLAVVPADAELDLKALARATGDRKVDTVPLKEVQPLTGYVRGGVTALGGKKGYPVFVDERDEHQGRRELQRHLDRPRLRRRRDRAPEQDLPADRRRQGAPALRRLGLRQRQLSLGPC
jgi:Cys-tRNA(Pro)/Cys-tRNA(Cys) deacylase